MGITASERHRLVVFPVRTVRRRDLSSHSPRLIPGQAWYVDFKFGSGFGDNSCPILSMLRRLTAGPVGHEGANDHPRLPGRASQILTHRVVSWLVELRSRLKHQTLRVAVSPVRLVSSRAHCQVVPLPSVRLRFHALAYTTWITQCSTLFN